MYAIVETGAKQYRVEVGTEFSVEKLQGEVGDTVSLDKVLLIKTEDETLVGTPYLEGAAVKASIVEQGKAPKVIIFKYLAKKDSRKKKGHRQPFTLLRVEAIEQV
ncbi:MAG TPA: 50S ribosomal protein L21 [Tissierellia bacterium]|jgi:large subunit ribosomal protein L21|nr:50S ribosomal protein L21 [Tissierellia bacterium]